MITLLHGNTTENNEGLWTYIFDTGDLKIVRHDQVAKHPSLCHLKSLEFVSPPKTYTDLNM